MLSLQSQLCAIRGAFHLCFKRNERNEFLGLKVCFFSFFSYNAGFVSTQSSNLLCLQLPSKHSAVTATNHLEATVNQERR